MLVTDEENKDNGVREALLAAVEETSQVLRIPAQLPIGVRLHLEEHLLITLGVEAQVTAELVAQGPHKKLVQERIVHPMASGVRVQFLLQLEVLVLGQLVEEFLG